MECEAQTSPCVCAPAAYVTRLRRGGALSFRCRVFRVWTSDCLRTNHLLALSKKEYCKKYPRQNIFKKIIKIPENGLFWRAQNTCPANTTALAEDIEVGAREFNVAVLVER